MRLDYDDAGDVYVFKDAFVTGKVLLILAVRRLSLVTVSSVGGR